MASHEPRNHAAPMSPASSTAGCPAKGGLEGVIGRGIGGDLGRYDSAFHAMQRMQHLPARCHLTASVHPNLDQIDGTLLRAGPLLLESVYDYGYEQLVEFCRVSFHITHNHPNQIFPGQISRWAGFGVL